MSAGRARRGGSCQVHHQQRGEHDRQVAPSRVRELYEDLGSPEKAALLGPCKVLPKEYANLSCRSIDLSGPEEVELLFAELLAWGSENLVAHRGGHRWVQTFEPVRLERAAEGAGLRPGGVYLITGGFDEEVVAVARDLHLLGALSWPQAVVDAFVVLWHFIHASSFAASPLQSSALASIQRRRRRLHWRRNALLA